MLSYVAFWINTSGDQRPAGIAGRGAFSAGSRKAADDARAAPSANGAMSHEAAGVQPDYAAGFDAVYARQNTAGAEKPQNWMAIDD